MKAYYNEIDKHAAQWLRNLIEAGLIPAGDVDARSIAEVQPDDLRGYDQCHFFAGIAGWSYALQLANWPVGRDVWTGSCPCQPFSAAGRRGGFADERHLWPEFYRLIAQCRPSVVFGEQVASKPGREWFSRVRTDLEDVGYRVGAADLCAAGVGAPHIRQRLWFVADSMCERTGRGTGSDPSPERAPAGARREHRDEHDAVSTGQDNPRGVEHATSNGWIERGPEPSGRGTEPRCGDRAVGLADSLGKRLEVGSVELTWQECEAIERSCTTGYLEYAERNTGRPGRASAECEQSIGAAATGPRNELGRPSLPRSWSEYDTVACLDGKARRIEPGTFPLAHGIPGRVGKLRAYGNAIVPEVAAEFIAAYRQCVD